MLVVRERREVLGVDFAEERHRLKEEGPIVGGSRKVEPFFGVLARTGSHDRGDHRVVIGVLRNGPAPPEAAVLGDAIELLHAPVVERSA